MWPLPLSAVYLLLSCTLSSHLQPWERGMKAAGGDTMSSWPRRLHLSPAWIRVLFSPEGTHTSLGLLLSNPDLPGTSSCFPSPGRQRDSHAE
ncbi:hypothetical protein Cadr_000006143 [Camelus dromedarius]|uniref:Uncharacterized protein n=1 Tax=Camelus dromedarius TaxID=9838 RepID=A0A5N4E3A9_CAMDR|nr:hypothetical protein Cadr_000006143 [Camelus dromedarius]